MADISKIKLPDNSEYDFKDPIARTSVGYGVVDSTSTSTKFTAQIPGVTKYYDGLAIILKNGVVTSAANFTIDINGLGGKPCYTNLAAATRDTTIFNVSYTMLFIYDSTRVSGGAWICYRGYDSNTNTVGYQLRTNNTVMNVSDTARYYKIYFTSANGQNWVPASVDSTNNATSARPVNQRPIDPFGRIVYTSASTSYAAGANLAATTIWDQYVLTLGYSFNRTGAALTLTTKRAVYIKCAPQTDGSAIIDSTTPYVQALPSTEDGKIYIFLGVATSATQIELVPYHPVYYYKDGAVRLWTNQVTSYTETDPTVPAWAKAPNKPTYTASEVGALPSTTTYVSSVNGQTGAVTLTTGNIENTAGYITGTDVAERGANAFILVVNGTSATLFKNNNNPVLIGHLIYLMQLADKTLVVQVINASGSQPVTGRVFEMSYFDLSTGTVKMHSIDGDTRYDVVLIDSGEGLTGTITTTTAPSASTTNPLMDGTASYGSGTVYARSNHVHPTDTSRQEILVSGTNIKTINGNSILGSGDLVISGGSGGGPQLLGETPYTLTEDVDEILLQGSGNYTYTVQSDTLFDFDVLGGSTNMATVSYEDGFYKLKAGSASAWYQTYIDITVTGLEVGTAYNFMVDSRGATYDTSNHITPGHWILYDGNNQVVAARGNTESVGLFAYSFTASTTNVRVRWYPSTNNYYSSGVSVGNVRAFYINKSGTTEHTEIISLSGSFTDKYSLYSVPSGATITSTPSINVYSVPQSGSGSLPLKGKKIVVFGDSIIGMVRGDTSPTAYIANYTGATVYNVGFGGCRMSTHPSTGYAAFSMWALAQAIATNDWTAQEAQKESGSDYFPEQLAILRGIDFNTVDYVVIHYGTNDFGGGVTIGEDSAATVTNTICGATRYSIETLLTAYPKLRIFISLPIFRFWDVSGTTVYSDTYTNSQNNTLVQVVEAIRMVAKEYNLSIIDNYYGLGINKVDATDYLSDGTHLTAIGRQYFGEYIGAKILGGSQTALSSGNSTISSAIIQLEEFELTKENTSYFIYFGSKEKRDHYATGVPFVIAFTSQTGRHETAIYSFSLKYTSSYASPYSNYFITEGRVSCPNVSYSNNDTVIRFSLDPFSVQSVRALSVPSYTTADNKEVLTVTTVTGDKTLIWDSIENLIPSIYSNITFPQAESALFEQVIVGLEAQAQQASNSSAEAFVPFDASEMVTFALTEYASGKIPVVSIGNRKSPVSNINGTGFLTFTVNFYEVGAVSNNVCPHYRIDMTISSSGFAVVVTYHACPLISIS